MAYWRSMYYETVALTYARATVAQTAGCSERLVDRLVQEVFGPAHRGLRQVTDRVLMEDLDYGLEQTVFSDSRE